MFQLVLFCKHCNPGLKLFKCIYSDGMWHDHANGKLVYKQLQLVERSYVHLANKSITCQLQRYRLVPKLHNLSHIRHDLGKQAFKGSRCFNILADSCEMNEDYIGKVARVSRRVSAKRNTLRTTQRVLVGSTLKLKAIKKSMARISGHM